MPPLHPPKEQSTLYAHSRGVPKVTAQEAATVAKCIKTRAPLLNFSEMELKGLPAGTENCVSCTELNLNQNEIRELPPPARFPPNLQVLKLTGNELSTIPDLSGLPVTQLFLGGNLLASAAGVLTTSASLLHISLSNNRLTSLDCSSGAGVVSLDLAGNDFDDLMALLYELKSLPKLKAVCLAGNPFCLMEGYRRKVLDVLPHLSYLDGEKLEEEDEEDDDAAGSGPMMFFDAPADRFQISIELKSLKVKDPSPPVPKPPPEAPSTDSKKPAKGAAEEGPRVPDLLYYIVFDAPGEPALHMLPTREEVVLPKDPASEAPAKGDKGKPQQPPVPPPAGGEETPKLPQGYFKHTLSLAANLEARNWLRDGINMKLYRTELQPTGDLETPEAEEGQPAPGPSPVYAPHTELLAEGTVAPREILDGQTFAASETVKCIPRPLLWDTDGYRRLAFDDPKQPAGKLATFKAKFRLHPPKEEAEGGEEGA